MHGQFGYTDYPIEQGCAWVRPAMYFSQNPFVVGSHLVNPLAIEIDDFKQPASAGDGR
jgi:hypothetical protein